MFKNQPAGLYVLSLANMGERFGYYTSLLNTSSEPTRLGMI